MTFYNSAEKRINELGCANNATPACPTVEATVKEQSVNELSGVEYAAVITFIADAVAPTETSTVPDDDIVIDGAVLIVCLY